MALEHALLVSLRERPATGIELTRRFDASIGFFWRATHQQIYRVLRRMADDGWVRPEAGGRGSERRYSVTEAGEAVLAEWVGSPTGVVTLRSEIAVKMRGAAYGDRGRLLADLEKVRADHRTRLDHFEHLERTQFPDPGALDGHDLDTWLVLRGGVKQEQFWIEWITEYLDTWTQLATPHRSAPRSADGRTA